MSAVQRTSTRQLAARSPSDVVSALVILLFLASVVLSMYAVYTQVQRLDAEAEFYQEKLRIRD